MKSFLTAALRNSALIVLAILVSGVLPALVQGYAWIDMANKANGISSLAAVLVDAPPCHYCDAARELQNNSRGDDGAPLPFSKNDFLKSVSIFESSRDPLSAKFAKVDLVFPFPADARAPRDLTFGPGSPPPRKAA